VEGEEVVAVAAESGVEDAADLIAAVDPEAVILSAGAGVSPKAVDPPASVVKDRRAAGAEALVANRAGGLVIAALALTTAGLHVDPRAPSLGPPEKGPGAQQTTGLPGDLVARVRTTGLTGEDLVQGVLVTGRETAARVGIAGLAQARSTDMLTAVRISTAAARAREATTAAAAMLLLRRHHRHHGHHTAAARAREATTAAVGTLLLLRRHRGHHTAVDRPTRDASAAEVGMVRKAGGSVLRPSLRPVAAADTTAVAGHQARVGVALLLLEEAATAAAVDHHPSKAKTNSGNSVNCHKELSR